MLDPLAVPNGAPPPAVTIHLLTHPQGQQIVVNHAVSGGWKAVQQLLLTALHIAVAQEMKEQVPKPPSLITPATLHPRFRPERG